MKACFSYKISTGWKAQARFISYVVWAVSAMSWYREMILGLGCFPEIECCKIVAWIQGSSAGPDMLWLLTLPTPTVGETRSSHAPYCIQWLPSRTPAVESHTNRTFASWMFYQASGFVIAGYWLAAWTWPSSRRAELEASRQWRVLYRLIE